MSPIPPPVPERKKKKRSRRNRKKQLLGCLDRQRAGVDSCSSLGLLNSLKSLYPNVHKIYSQPSYADSQSDGIDQKLFSDSIEGGVSFITHLILSVVEKLESRITPDFLVGKDTQLLSVLKNVLKRREILGNSHLEVFNLLLKVLIYETEKPGSSVELIRQPNNRDLLTLVCSKALAARLHLNPPGSLSPIYSGLCRKIIDILSLINPNILNPPSNMNDELDTYSLMIKVIDHNRLAQDLSWFMVLNGMTEFSHYLLEDLVKNFVKLFILSPRYCLYKLMPVKSEGEGGVDQSASDLQRVLTTMAAAHWILPEVRSDPRRYLTNLGQEDHGKDTELILAARYLESKISKQQSQQQALSTIRSVMDPAFINMAPRCLQERLLNK